MVKKMISGFLALLLILCVFSPAAYADDEHQHTFGEVTDTVDTKGLKLPNGQDFPVNVSITKSPCSTPGISCGKVLYSWNFGGRGGSFVDDKDLPVAEVIKRWYEWTERFYGNNVGFTPFQAGGGSASPGGVGRNPAGYAGEGVPSVNSTGVLCMVVEPLGMCSNWQNQGFYTNDNENLIVGASSGGSSYPSYNEVVVYKFVTPASGIYYIGNLNGSSYNYGSISIFSSNYWRLKYLKRECTKQYEYSGRYDAGQTVYFRDHTDSYHYDQYNNKYLPEGAPYKFSLNPICIFYEPYDTSTIVNQTNITINNNTFNGNIYVDNTNKLTYIYPQYTVNNETKISNNPIIYNEETKQYYTYDQTTNNYYYITYGDPVPTPTPSPSPDPGGSGGGSSGGDGSGGGSGDSPSGSGSSWWEKLLDKLGSALIDGLLDAVKGILKLLFDLFSSILGWIIWLCSKVFDLFPFLPPGVGALLVGGVVVCFILAFIKFIRG